ncbi:MAG: cation:proton antiporter [Bullifex sp.]|nr:cation:proton antiporter [Spirochaetales bacterium]MDY5777298.1 cation:proton antiporter [Bullifex sp.]
MLLSLSLIFLSGLAGAYIAQALRLPRIIGMLAAGIIVGPCCLGVLDEKILYISPDLRKLALVIILIKAGLSLNLEDLKRVGRPSLLLSFLPAAFEGAAVTFIAPLLFGISYTEAALLGSVLAAVSPAVVIPKMTELIDSRYGTGKSIPQMILAGASLDDIFVIVLFSTFLTACRSGTLNLSSFADIPVSVLSGIAAGIISGLILARIMKSMKSLTLPHKVIMILSLALLLTGAEDMIKPYFAFSGLLAVISSAAVVRVKDKDSAQEAASFTKLWAGAEIILFVLIGAAVDINYTLRAGIPAILLLAFSLSVRSLGVILSLSGTALNRKERLFTVFSYLPKATVQAAIGGIPLAMGLSSGSLILSVAVLSIVVTAPLGALLMEVSYRKLLEREK